MLKPSVCTQYVKNWGDITFFNLVQNDTARYCKMHQFMVHACMKQEQEIVDQKNVSVF